MLLIFVVDGSISQETRDSGVDKSRGTSHCKCAVIKQAKYTQETLHNFLHT